MSVRAPGGSRSGNTLSNGAAGRCIVRARRLTLSASYTATHIRCSVTGRCHLSSTVGIVHGIVSGIFRAAVRDGTKLPKVTKSRVEPLATEVLLGLADAVPDRYRALVILSGDSGMRQGECFGLTVDRIDFLRRMVLVDRQLVTISSRPSFLAPPKTAASVRSIPLPTVVVDALAAHLAAYPPLEDGFLFVTDAGRPIRRTAFGDVWRTGGQGRRCASWDRLP